MIESLLLRDPFSFQLVLGPAILSHLSDLRALFTNIRTVSIYWYFDNIFIYIILKKYNIFLHKILQIFSSSLFGNKEKGQCLGPEIWRNSPEFIFITFLSKDEKSEGLEKTVEPPNMTCILQLLWRFWIWI